MPRSAEEYGGKLASDISLFTSQCQTASKGNYGKGVLSMRATLALALPDT